MSKHEQYEDICAAASIGEASPEELAALESHASNCESCRKAYASYLQIAAQHFAIHEQSPELSLEVAQACLASELFAHRFYERAEQEGIFFSPIVSEHTGNARTGLWLLLRQGSWTVLGRALAATVVLVLVVSAVYYLKSLPRADRKVRSVSSEEVLEQNLAELEGGNRALEMRVSELKADLFKAERQVSAREADLEALRQERQLVESERNSLSVELKELHREFAESQNARDTDEQELARVKIRGEQVEARLVAYQARIQELGDQLEEKSAALDKERELLAVGHDVTDLMGARNLHIVDVVDTDARGKTRPAFGRIFFTEGKSLVFYAYDLNETKMQKANYQYRIWAKKESGNGQIQSLGIFYADDKLQKRWVFKCNDPRILSEIDSVFVTLEPANADPLHPKGPNLMYAYLHAQPNHP